MSSRTSQPAQNKPITMVQGKKPSLPCYKSLRRILSGMAVDSEEEMGMVMLALLLSKKDRKAIKKRAEEPDSQEQPGKAGTVPPLQHQPIEVTQEPRVTWHQ